MGGYTAPLWLAVSGMVLQLVSLGTDFYIWEGKRQSAWFGTPHASELILLSALVTGILAALTAAERCPVPGRKAGAIIGSVGALAALQLAYRMVAPPFGGRIPEHAGLIGDSCLYYCWPSEAASAELLLGIWLAMLGCLMVIAGGAAYAYSLAARHAPARAWLAAEQTDMTPWLALGALGGVGQFGFGYTFFSFYRTIRPDGATTWSGWLPTPHTASLVLAISVGVVALVWRTAIKQAPLRAQPLGAVLALLGLLAFVRIGYRILVPPFGSDQVQVAPAAWLALASAVLIIVGGVMQAITANPARALGSDSRR